MHVYVCVWLHVCEHPGLHSATTNQQPQQPPVHACCLRNVARGGQHGRPTRPCIVQASQKSLGTLRWDNPQRCSF